MSLRLRLALIFALVAFGTAGVIALATPAIVEHGFGQLVDETEARGQGQGQGLGQGPREGRGPGRAQSETTLAIITLGFAAAADHDIGIVVDRIDRIRNGHPCINRENLLYISRITLSAIRNKE